MLTAAANDDDVPACSRLPWSRRGGNIRMGRDLLPKSRLNGRIATGRIRVFVRGQTRSSPNREVEVNRVPAALGEGPVCAGCGCGSIPKDSRTVEGADDAFLSARAPRGSGIRCEVTSVD
jgi:hypothetical protein